MMADRLVVRASLFVSLWALSSVSISDERCVALRKECQFSNSANCKAVKKTKEQAERDKLYFLQTCSRTYLVPILNLLLSVANTKVE